MAEFKLTTVYVDYQHLMNARDILAKAVTEQYYRSVLFRPRKRVERASRERRANAFCYSSFLPYLRRSLQNLVKKYAPAYLYTNSHTNATTASGLNVRTFSLAFYNLPLVEGIRDMRTEKIGKLSSISGTVTRTSEVRPELIYGTFVCHECKGVVRDVEQQFKYTEVASRLFLRVRDLELTLLASSIAHRLPQPHLLEPHGMEALDRAVQVLRLAEGSYPGELERDSYW